MSRAVIIFATSGAKIVNNHQQPTAICLPESRIPSLIVLIGLAAEDQRLIVEHVIQFVEFDPMLRRDLLFDGLRCRYGLQSSHSQPV